MMRLLIAVGLVAFSSVARAQSASVSVTLSEWKVRLDHDTVQAGPVKFQIKNNGTTSHAFYVKGEGADKGTQPIAAHQTGSLTVTLKPGTYEVYCPLSEKSHRMAGMLAKLTVIGGETSTGPSTPQTQP